MQTWLSDLVGAWIFYSILPAPKGLKPSFKSIARFAPLIGIILGSIQSALWIFSNYFGWSYISSSLIVIAFGAFLTGGIHIDGLMDTFDGLGAGPKRCKEAMKDSRIGASGIQALLIIILMQIASLISLGEMAIFALPISSFFGRCAPIWAIQSFPYLQPNGTSFFHRENRNGIKDFIPAISILICILMSMIFFSIGLPLQIYLLSSIFFGIVLSFAIPEYLGRRLGGHSGDSYGASLVIVETLILTIMGFTLKIV
ncbi:adenosylcobinamide-GDP ribazoletransferase [Prochlorococcus sp. MIT 1341]|uniref:adenosylcobinamide-GDP ribazoletransferase n=1 Tax=Prochlorococcus sp. MIT 1341 TaxID=3096221 RepID=UPI002A748DC6|nr:adenosylcobinamide-GDP ribazoletransferase [Prochlorococcus sp. MIT 1341]